MISKFNAFSLAPFGEDGSEYAEGEPANNREKHHRGASVI